MFIDSNLKKEIQSLGTKSQHIHIYKSGAATQVYLAEYLRNHGHNVVLILPPHLDTQEYSLLADIFAHQGSIKPNFWEESWFFLPSLGQKNSSTWGKIWTNLFGILQKSNTATVVPADTLLYYLPTTHLVRDTFLLLMPGEEINPDTILDKLVSWGYTRAFTVTSPGEIALRGDILDVFPPGYQSPVRMDFFGDHLESIRTFEPLTQRSIQDLEECLIMPVAACIAEEELMRGAREKADYLRSIGEINPAFRQNLEKKLEDGSRDYPCGLFYSQPGCMADFLPGDAYYLLVDSARIRTTLEEEEWKLKQWSEDQGYPKKYIFQPTSRARSLWQNKSQIIFDRLVMGQKTSGLDLWEKEIKNFSDIFWKPQETRRPWPTFVQALHDWKKTANQVILAFNTPKSREKFFKAIENEGLELETDYRPEKPGLFALVVGLGTGKHMVWNHVYLLGEDVIQPGKRQKTSTSQQKFAGISRVDEIQAGDLLVHRDYGLGRFEGLERISTDTSANDYLLLRYANDDKLYIPVDRFGLVQKYKGPEGANPALDKLGGSGWSKTKDRARKAIKKIARDLVNMYAYRRVAKGYNYHPLGEMYQEFVNTFGFEETPDQEQAIKEVMDDMESPEPMDRLVCGDVGFGKTEVAMRAAFRAVMDGKQVAMLCPTTVLAEQHYVNFMQRMQDFAVNVRMLSRFVPRSRQKTILEATKRGEVDILIGTHRLLSQDVVIPKLALLILDEEQRFGVRHKEKLKEFRQNIDVLTLTATPIPRTLQLSISGIRTLSVIETPPQDRKPVESSLIEKDKTFLQSALRRELDRKGQVFWVYNRVQGLDRVLEYVQNLVPEARVAKAHGQMPEKDLEETMHKFWHHEIDVLVCTAIIESGLDFPRANTLIVDQAQTFGLGQLYQLRGRVGRSEEQAYAYFVVPSVNQLPEQTKKRMQIILDMDYLGAGFQLAMEDLRLRGAGNILGEVQSGQIGKVGLDLFLEMLQEEVGKLKGDEDTSHKDLEINIGFSAFIPEDYIPDPSERLKYYRIFSACTSGEDFDQIAQELKDRFGNLPQELQNFIQVLKIKHALKPLGPERADFLNNKLSIEWGSDAGKLNPDNLVSWVEQNKDFARLVPPSKLELRLTENPTIYAFLEEMHRVVHDLSRNITS